MSAKASIFSGNMAWVAGVVVAMGVSVYALVATGVLDGGEPAAEESSVSENAPVAEGSAKPAQDGEEPTAPAAQQGTGVQENAQKSDPAPVPKEANEPEETVSSQTPEGDTSRKTDAVAADLEEDAKSTPQADPKDEVAEENTPENAPEITPTFDLVRVDADGNTVVAGAAAPGGMLGILLDGIEVALAPVGRDGKFAAILSFEPSENPRVLSLIERREDGDVLSDATVIVAPVIAVAESVETEAPAAKSVEETDVADAERAPEGTETVSTEVAQSTPVAPEKTTAPMRAEAETVAVDKEPGETQAPTELVNSEQTSPEATQVTVSGNETAKTAVETVRETAETAIAAEAQDAVTETVSNAAEETTKTATAAASDQGAADTPAALASPAPKAPAVIVSDAEGVRVVQPAAPADAVPEVLAAVSIDSISYTDAGAVMVAGRGNSEGFVRLYLNNTQAATTQIDSVGLWSTQLDDVAGGIYEMRADEVDADGKVVSRVVTPFKRETPETVAKARAQAQAVTKAEAEDAAPEGAGQANSEVAAAAPLEQPTTADVTSDPETSETAEAMAPQAESKPAKAAQPKATVSSTSPETTAAPASAQAAQTESADTNVAQTAASTPVQAEAAPSQSEPAAQPQTPQPPVRIVTVQPGATLWAIARDRYGEGLAYVQVFEANKDKIRDPDLIYPGQVFTVPEE